MCHLAAQTPVHSGNLQRGRPSIQRQLSEYPLRPWRLGLSCQLRDMQFCFLMNRKQFVWQMSLFVLVWGHMLDQVVDSRYLLQNFR